MSISTEGDDTEFDSIPLDDINPDPELVDGEAKAEKDQDATMEPPAPIPLTNREKLYGLWFITKSCTSITALLILLVFNQKQIDNFYDSVNSCDICYANAAMNPDIMYEFNRCGTEFNEYTTNGTETPQYRYEQSGNLLWRESTGNLQSTWTIVIGAIDWVVIMYSTYVSVNRVKKAIQLGHVRMQEQAKIFLIHNALMCHMIVFSISNTLWLLLQDTNGCYASHLPDSFSTTDWALAFVYLMCFIITTFKIRNLQSSKRTTWLHIAALFAYAIYSVVASIYTIVQTGDFYYFCFVITVFVCIFDIPMFFHNSSSLREYLGYQALGSPHSMPTPQEEPQLQVQTE